uniref:Uncharacterized protein n=1 Tax=Caenorhabditis japonica TaxID=281687 RepID=A0A8R1IG45_CAEJA
MSNPKTTTETKVAKGGEKDATIRFKRRPSSAMPQRETEWTVREYLKSERSERVRKNKFDEMSKDYICSSSIEEAVRQDMEEDASADEDDEEDDELVEWSAYPGSAASNEELNEDGAHGGEWDDDDLGDDYNQFAPDDQYDHVELDYLSDSDALKARRRQIANYFLIKDPNSLNELDELTDEQISELLPDESMLERYTDKEIKIEVMEDEIVEKKPELL